MITIRQMIDREVNACMSSIVSTLAAGSGTIDVSSRNANRNDAGKALSDLAEQASELCYPIPDYEEAAIQAGWTHVESLTDRAEVYRKGDDENACCNWQELCEANNIEPYDREVYEHWSVSTWLAEKLQEHGEKVDNDFAGLCIWARTCTGQAIEADDVIKRIYADMIKA